MEINLELNKVKCHIVCRMSDRKNWLRRPLSITAQQKQVFRARKPTNLLILLEIYDRQKVRGPSGKWSHFFPKKAAALRQTGWPRGRCRLSEGDGAQRKKVRSNCSRWRICFLWCGKNQLLWQGGPPIEKDSDVKSIDGNDGRWKLPIVDVFCGGNCFELN